MNEVLSAEEALKKEGFFTSTTKGTSMLPMLEEGKDSVIIVPLKRRPAKGDVILYKVNDLLVLHRIVSLKNGIITCGDNCTKKENNILQENILGVVSEFYKGNKKISVSNPCYRLYSFVKCNTVFLRRKYRSLKARIKK